MNFSTKQFRCAAMLSLGALLANNSKAAVYTAVLSGNFNSAATWGGVAPGSLLSSDVIIIPAGLTVNLTNNVTFSGTSSLTVLGSLKSSTSGTGLIMTSGSLSGAGSMELDTLALGLTSGISYTGNLLVRNMTSTGANVSSNANIVVRNSLNLTAGTLTIASGKLNMGMNTSIWLTGGVLATSGSGLLNLDSTYSVTYASVSGSTGVELSGSGLNGITVDAGSSNTINMSSNTNVRGMLTLNSGNLSLNGYTLTFTSTGDLSASGTGMFSGSASSSLSINSASSLSGSLRFVSGSNILKNLTLNTSSSSASAGLGTDLNINSTLGLNSGRLRLGNYNLKLNTGAMISGGTSASYVITDGSGALTMNLAASGTDTFEVGTISNYTPMAVIASSSSVSSDVSLHVSGSVLVNGTSGSDLSLTQPMVKNTWFVSSSASTGIDFSLMAMWNSSMEVNSFDRTQAYISHYTSGSWDHTTTASATTSASLYTMTRSGITSLSPFMVTGKDAVTTSIKNNTVSNTSILLYPNPASNSITIKSAVAVENISVYDIAGHLVLAQDGNNNEINVSRLAPGAYVMSIQTKDGVAKKQFSKQ